MKEVRSLVTCDYQREWNMSLLTLLPFHPPDCDRDSECAEGLVCFQRDAFEPVPYCEGVGRDAGVDICIYPTPEVRNSTVQKACMFIDNSSCCPPSCISLVK